VYTICFNITKPASCLQCIYVFHMILKIQGKVPCASLIKHYAMKAYGGVHFLDLGSSWRWVVSSTPLPLYPPVPIEYEVGWTPEPVWTTWRRENYWPYKDSNSDPSVVQPVASRYTDYTQWLFPQTALTSWSLSGKHCLFPVRYELKFCIGRIVCADALRSSEDCNK
jgi:hypothetical protein